MAYIKRPDENVPTAEKRSTYEKSVPEMRAWPKTFIAKRRIKAGKENRSIPKRRGRLAKPILKKGTGLGIIISIAERKKQNPPNNGIRESAFLVFNDNPSIRSCKHFRHIHDRTRIRSLRTFAELEPVILLRRSFLPIRLLHQNGEFLLPEDDLHLW